MSVIFQIFHKNKGNSTAIDRIFRGKMGYYSAKASPYGQAKAVVSLRSAQAIFIRHTFRVKVSKYNNRTNTLAAMH